MSDTPSLVERLRAMNDCGFATDDLMAEAAYRIVDLEEALTNRAEALTRAEAERDRLASQVKTLTAERDEAHRIARDKSEQYVAERKRVETMWAALEPLASDDGFVDARMLGKLVRAARAALSSAGAAEEGT